MNASTPISSAIELDETQSRKSHLADHWARDTSLGLVPQCHGGDQIMAALGEPK